MTEVLVVDDERAICESVEYALRKAGYGVSSATSLSDAGRALSAQTALVVLDLMLPDGSGLDWLVELQPQLQRGLAVIVLSSRDSEADRIAALELGADDYVTKPFSPREVVARVQAVLRRLVPGRSTGIDRALPRLTVDSDRRRVWVGEQSAELTRVEFDLLWLLYQKPGQAFARAKMIDEVWGEGFALSDRTIDSHIKALRKKLADLGGAPEWIETVRGVGYRCSYGEPTP